MNIRATLLSYLQGVVSEPEVAELYASLVVLSPQTVSQLSRTSGIERTKIYRVLPELQRLGLVIIQIDEHRQLLHAAPLDTVQELLQSRAKHFNAAAKHMPQLMQQLQGEAVRTTSVLFFKEQSGVEQLFWNQTKAKSEVVSLLSENMQTHVSPAFFDRWIERCNQRGIVSRSLVDDAFLKAQKKYYGRATGHSLKHWSARTLPAKYSSIPHRTTVYDDVVTYFSWQDGDLFGIEIHNAMVAQTQRQYFELLWDISSPLIKD